MEDLNLNTTNFKTKLEQPQSGGDSALKQSTAGHYRELREFYKNYSKTTQYDPYTTRKEMSPRSVLKKKARMRTFAKNTDRTKPKTI